jgi:putative hydrolase of HD superfamily
MKKARPRSRGARGDERVADYLHELGLLKLLRRSGWWLAGIRDAESVAEHSFRTAAVAWFLARQEGAEAGRVLAMAIFHDASETRTLDLHRLARKYIDGAKAEAKASREQIGRLPGGLATALKELLDEERVGETLEARVVKDADRLECLLQAREYQAQGHSVDEWIQTSTQELSTRSAKALARAILRTHPGRWRRSGGG